MKRKTNILKLIGHGILCLIILAVFTLLFGYGLSKHPVITLALVLPYTLLIWDKAFEK